MHQHERVTNADRLFEEHIRRLLNRDPHITHLIACERGHRLRATRKTRRLAERYA
jgi:hypothetical protein